VTMRPPGRSRRKTTRPMGMPQYATAAARRPLRNGATIARRRCTARPAGRRSSGAGRPRARHHCGDGSVAPVTAR
jgi:hypothetical protein